MRLQSQSRTACLLAIVYCVASSRTKSIVVSGQFVDEEMAYCPYAETMARTLFRQHTNACSYSRLTCPNTIGNGIVCSPTCAYGSNLASTTCGDSCSYSYGGYTVSRAAGGTFGIARAYNGVSEPFYGSTWNYEYTAGATGSFRYSYGSVLQQEGDELFVRPTEDGFCDFEWNGETCACTNNYCDATKTRSARTIDCSGIPGGGVIDFCEDFEITTNSSLLEILVTIPEVVCQTNGSGHPSTPSGGPRLQASALITIAASLLCLRFC